MKQSSSSLVILESVDDVVDVRKKNKFVKWPLKGKKPKKGSADEDGSNSDDHPDDTEQVNEPSSLRNSNQDKILTVKKNSRSNMMSAESLEPFSTPLKQPAQSNSHAASNKSLIVDKTIKNSSQGEIRGSSLERVNKIDLHNSSISSKQSLDTLQQSELSSDTFDLLPLTPRRMANFETNNNTSNNNIMINNSKDKEPFVIKVSDIDGDHLPQSRHSPELNSNINNNEQNKVSDPESEGSDGNNQQGNQEQQQIPIARPLNNLRPKRQKQHVKYHTLTGDGMDSEKHEHHVIAGYNTNSTNFQPPVVQQVKRIKTHQKSHSTGLEIKNDNTQNNHNSSTIEVKTVTRVKRHTKTRSDELHSNLAMALTLAVNLTVEWNERVFELGIPVVSLFGLQGEISVAIGADLDFLGTLCLGLNLEIFHENKFTPLTEETFSLLYQEDSARIRVSLFDLVEEEEDGDYYFGENDTDILAM